MELALTIFSVNSNEYKITEQLAEQNLVHYASDAADKMRFGTLDELQDAVLRAMELCEATGVPVKTNFRRIFKASPLGLVSDWKLSSLAYYLVQLNGDASNPRVAKLQIELLRTAFA